ncbi:hypothetical protein D6829_02585 [Candidatus Pacearchaeota archaeon]|nr:MAG: hypothetical protein D6829_02585 [Candidatus Pacearchaeota archaeon]
MGKVVVRNAVSRKPGHLYYVDSKGNVCEAKMARGGKKRKKKAAKKKTARRKTAKKTARRKTAKKTARRKKRR